MSIRILRSSAIDCWEMAPQDSLDQATVLLFDQVPERISVVHDPEPARRSPRYLKERERVWQEKKSVYGDKLWNGRVCAVRHLSVEGRTVVVRLAACEYKDIVFKKHLGCAELRRRFPGEVVDVHAFTAALPIMDDGRAILGVVGPGTIQSEGQLDLIGGTLNLDERPIASFDDIKRVTALELEEETGMSVSVTRLEPVSINFHGGCCFFLLWAQVERERVFARFSANEELATLVPRSYEQLTEGRHDITEDLAFVLTYVTDLKALFNRSRDADLRCPSSTRNC